MDRKKIIFSILKELEKGNEPSSNDYELTIDEFGGVVEQMIEMQLIENASVIRAGIGNKVKMVFLNNIKIRSRGYDYLEENSGWNKTYSVLKEIREWIKL